MTVADNRTLGYRVYEAINAKDVAALDELFDPQVIRHAAGEIGIESARKALTNAFTTFPDQRFVVEDLIAEGDKVALRVTVQGIPVPPGQPLPIIMEIFRIENGRVAEVWGAGTLRLPAEA
jgi:predicted ester cyclase